MDCFSHHRLARALPPRRTHTAWPHRGLEGNADDQALSSPSAPKASGGSSHRGCVDKVQLRKVAIFSC